jgi:hypothetical protein
MVQPLRRMSAPLSLAANTHFYLWQKNLRLPVISNGATINSVPNHVSSTSHCGQRQKEEIVSLDLTAVIPDAAIHAPVAEGAGADWMLCQVGKQLHAIPIDCVIEIMRVLPIEPITGAPAYISGVCIIRGEPQRKMAATNGSFPSRTTASASSRSISPGSLRCFSGCTGAKN